MRDALEPWIEMLRAARVLDPDDEALYGDAGELIEAGITDIRYVDDGVAAVALAHDGYVFECGLTAAELRYGLTAEQRLLRRRYRDESLRVPGQHRLLRGAGGTRRRTRHSLSDRCFCCGNE